MTLSAKWSTVSLFTAMALGAGAFAFSGCTVTSGTINDDGGSVRPDSGRTDGSTETDGGTDEDATAPVCADNAQTNAINTAECQACLEENCCDELRACFNATGQEVDCNVYQECRGTCYGGPEDEFDTCLEECDLAAGETIVTAFDAIIACGGANADCATACGIE